MKPGNEIDTSYVPTSQDFQEEELDLGDYLAVLAESKWLILLVTLLVLLAGITYIWIATPQYQVDALIQVEENNNGKNSLTASALGDTLAPLLMGDTVVSAELQILDSRMVLGKVVDNLRLAVSANPVYFPVIGSAIARGYDPAAGLAEPWFGLKQYTWGGEAIKVETFDVPTANLGDTFILEADEKGHYRLLGPKTGWWSDLPIVLEGKVGETARAELDGEPLRLFVSELKARPGTHFNLAHDDRLSVINKLDKALTTAEEGKKSGVISIKLGRPNPVQASTIVNEIANIYLRQNVERRSAEAAQTLSFLQQQLPAMKQNLEASETSLNAYRLQHGSVDLPKEVELVLAKIVEAEQQTIQLKQKREELIRRFTPAHPTIAALDAQLATFNKQLNDLNKQIKNLPNTQQEIVALTRDMAVNTTLYTGLLNDAQELQLAKAGTIGNVRIIDYAVPPIRPDWPQKGLILMLSLVLGVFLGIVTAFLRRSLLKGVEDPDQLEKQLGLPVYATILHSQQQGKLLKQRHANNNQPPMLASSYPEDLAVESLRSLRTTLHFVLLDTKNNIIKISGPSPGVGKTFITANLGTILASAGKQVLLIDADLRKGQLHRYLGLSRDLGLSDFISGIIPLEQAIHHTAIDGLALLPTGTIPPNPSELLLHERFALCLDEATKAYDYILIDCPPVLAVADAAIVGRLAGTALLVVKAGVNAMREIEQSVKRLKQAGVNLRGLLFNDVKLASRRYGYSSYKYVYQYAYDKKK